MKDFNGAQYSDSSLKNNRAVPASPKILYTTII
jgi:hypothetical protein